MNLHRHILISLLAAGLFSAIVKAQPAHTSEIVLNGVTIMGEDRRAFFKVSFTDGTPVLNFILAEGEARHGIELLTVDTRLNAVTIRDQGLIKKIPICKTPELAGYMAATIGGTVADGSRSAASTGADGNGQDNPSENLPESTKPVVAAWTVSGGISGNAEDGNTDAGNAGGSNSKTTGRVYQYWVRSAQQIEKARLATAQRVMDGKWEPYPLTPLTPPGTPMQLIGSGSVFMDHGPGIILPGN